MSNLPAAADPDTPTTYSPPNTIFGFSAGRVVAMLSPYIATLSGLVAAWLFVHFPGLHIFGSEAQTARLIVEGTTFLLVAAITYAIHHKWLDGLSKWERGVTSDLPGDTSIVMPLMPPDAEIVDFNDGSGEPDEGDLGSISDEEDDRLGGEGKGMPLGFDREV
jgi:hypothetical protein